MLSRVACRGATQPTRCVRRHDVVTGPDLYAMYVDALYDEGVGVDDWNSLDEVDQAAWTALARKVRLADVG